MSFQNEIDQSIKRKDLYFLGDQLPPDWYAAHKQWLALAENGEVKAEYNIGVCLYKGLGTDKDVEKAIDLFKVALSKGEPRSAFNLYAIYSETDSDYFNQTTANEFLQLAIDRKDSRALAHVQALKQANESDEREQARMNELRAQAEKKRALDEQHEQFLIENKKSIGEQNELLSSIIDALNNFDKAAADFGFESAKKKGYAWASKVEALSRLDITAHKGYKEKDTSMAPPVVVNGTVFTPTVVLATYHTVKINIKNNSEKPIGFKINNPKYGIEDVEVPPNKSKEIFIGKIDDLTPLRKLSIIIPDMGIGGNKDLEIQLPVLEHFDGSSGKIILAIVVAVLLIWYKYYN